MWTERCQKQTSVQSAVNCHASSPVAVVCSLDDIICRLLVGYLSFDYTRAHCTTTTSTPSHRGEGWLSPIEGKKRHSLAVMVSILIFFSPEPNPFLSCSPYGNPDYLPEAFFCIFRAKIDKKRHSVKPAYCSLTAFIQPVSNVHPWIRRSVRPYVCPSTIRFFDFKEIWHVGRSRWVMHDGMQHDPILVQGQGHEPSWKCGHFQKLSLPPFTMRAGDWSRILKTRAQYRNLMGPDFFIFVLVFVSRDFELGKTLVTKSTLRACFPQLFCLFSYS